MVRQKDNKGVYVVCRYLVVLEHLQNNYYGSPRYEATLIDTTKLDGGYCGGHVYRFTGHYFGDQEEAAWIVEYHEKKANMMKGGTL